MAQDVHPRNRMPPHRASRRLPVGPWWRSDSDDRSAAFDQLRQTLRIAQLAFRISSVTPLCSDAPRRIVESSRSFRVKFPGDRDHLVRVISSARPARRNTRLTCTSYAMSLPSII